MSHLTKEELAEINKKALNSLAIQRKKNEANSNLVGATAFALAPSQKVGYYSYNICLMVTSAIVNLLFMHLVLEWF